MIEAQWRAGRALLDWSQTDLARRVGVAPLTIKRMEAGAPNVSEDVRARARAALEAAGIIFVEENGEGPGVRLRKQWEAGDYVRAGQHGSVKVERVGADPDGVIRADRTVTTKKKAE